MATDVMYYVYETFATETLENLALTFIILPFMILFYAFVILAFGAASSEQFATRWRHLRNFESGRWYRFFGYLIEPWIQILLLMIDTCVPFIIILISYPTLSCNYNGFYR